MKLRQVGPMDKEHAIDCYNRTLANYRKYEIELYNYSFKRRLSKKAKADILDINEILKYLSEKLEEYRQYIF